MANKSVTIVVRGTVDGDRVNWGLKRAKEQGLQGSYWIKWNSGSSQKWDGPHKDEWVAKAAKLKKERELRTGVPANGPAHSNRATLVDAVTRFLDVKRIESNDEHSANRWKWELELFIKVSHKTFVDEITKEDSYAYWKWYQERKREHRTIHNRLASINRFLRDPICNVAADRYLSNKELPAFDEKAVDYYSVEDLQRLFAACAGEEKIRYQFFLYSGCRREGSDVRHLAGYRF